MNAATNGRVPKPGAAATGTRDVVVTVGEQEWEVLAEAAEAAGMSVPDYVSWCVRIQAARAANPRSRRADNVIAARRPATGEDESESAAWVETFSRRCAHHTDRDAEI